MAIVDLIDPAAASAATDDLPPPPLAAVATPVATEPAAADTPPPVSTIRWEGDATDHLMGLGLQCGPLIQYRELFVNGVEALKGALGLVFFTVVLRAGVAKLACVDTGVGMTAAEMATNLTTAGASVKGKNNMGMGVRLATMPFNRAGVEWLSLSAGQVSRMVMRTDASGNTAMFGPTPAGLSELPDEIVRAGHGTMVVLHGNSADETTTIYENAERSATKWVSHFMNNRFSTLPANLLPRQGAKKAGGVVSCPEVSGGEGSAVTSVRSRNAFGKHYYLDQLATLTAEGTGRQYRGTVQLPECSARYWVIKADLAMKGKFRDELGLTSSAAILVGNEIHQVPGVKPSAQLREIGISYPGKEYMIVVHFEPYPGLGLRQDPTRVSLAAADGRVLMELVNDWGKDFHARLPTVIKELVASTQRTYEMLDSAELVKELNSMLAADIVSDLREAQRGGWGSRANRRRRRVGDGKRRKRRKRTNPSGSGGRDRSSKPALQERDIPSIEWHSSRADEEPADALSGRVGEYSWERNELRLNGDDFLFVAAVRRIIDGFGDRAAGFERTIEDELRRRMDLEMVRVVLVAVARSNGSAVELSDPRHLEWAWTAAVFSAEAAARKSLAQRLPKV